MIASLCIHAHLYQPPREDPWLGTILTEGSAAPMSNWNERILKESYAPLAWARRLDAQNHIIELVNCYEWINFNVGPTLVHWMREHAPEVLKRMREGDEKSIERLGHGNAMAQCYHHTIMPLTSRRDKILETAWAVEDFRRQFGRDPEGMWLPECAVDIPSLEVLADRGIRFVILAPRQAKAVIIDGEIHAVDEGSLDTREPYRISLPSGNSITAVFYHGALSQSIAFEGLLRDGELFWQRLASESRKRLESARGNSLLCLATDGETYGHHFTFGEMALAHVLAQGRAKRDNIRLINVASYIAGNPPTREVVLHEPSSWSCVHGVERWRSDCGCSDGGHSQWNQQWRAPLRDALGIMRTEVDEHYADAASSCLTDPEAALRDYGRVLANPENNDDFARQWFTGDTEQRDKAWKLLAMQEQALAAFASCAWFFDDIARIEPENAMTFALRAIDLMKESGGRDISITMAATLEKARSNQSEAGTGKDVFEREVVPRRNDPAALCLLSWLLENAASCSPEACGYSMLRFPNVSVEIFPQGPEDPAVPWGMQTGKAIIRVSHEEEGSAYTWRIMPPTPRRHYGKSFVHLEDSNIQVWPESMGVEPDTAEIRSRAVSELSRSMREYLLSQCLERWEKLNRPELRAVATHALSLLTIWDEAQKDVPRPQLWVGFIPYMVLESMLDDHLTTKKRMQIEHFLSLHLTSRSKSLGRHLITRAFLFGLGVEKFLDDTGNETTVIQTDAALAEWARRIRFIMPDMDWWDVQNQVWGKGLDAYPALAVELGFKLSS